jgi:hypothetical protein
MGSSGDHASTVSGPAAGVLIALGLIVAICVIVIPVIAMWRIFTKAGRPGWAVLIPFYNTYVLIKICGRPGWWLLLMFIPVVDFVIVVILMLDLAKSFGKSTTFAIFALILFSFVGMLILGFGEARYLGPAGSDRPPGGYPQPPYPPQGYGQQPGYQQQGGYGRQN